MSALAHAHTRAQKCTQHTTYDTLHRALENWVYNNSRLDCYRYLPESGAYMILGMLIGVVLR